MGRRYLDPMSVTAERLRLRMDETGVQQDELAEAVGCSQSAISQILIGATRNSRFLPRIAEHLGVALPWLLGSSDVKEPDKDGIALSPDERELISLFRSMSEHQRRSLLAVLDPYKAYAAA